MQAYKLTYHPKLLTFQIWLNAEIWKSERNNNTHGNGSVIQSVNCLSRPTQKLHWKQVSFYLGQYGRDRHWIRTKCLVRVTTKCAVKRTGVVKEHHIGKYNKRFNGFANHQDDLFFNIQIILLYWSSLDSHIKFWIFGSEGQEVEQGVIKRTLEEYIGKLTWR